MSSAEEKRTSVSVYSDTKTKFDQTKPDGLSADQFVSVLIDHWQGE